MNTERSRQILLGIIVISLLILAGIYIGVPAWNKKIEISNDKGSIYVKEPYQRSPEKVPYGTLGSEEYDYYSLYGWRTEPPYEYPQKTINTPFDVEMRECAGKCNGRCGNGQCLESCRQNALQAAINNSKFFPSQKKLSRDPNTVDIENYSNLDYSLSLDISHLYRPLRDETKPFCFYR